MGIVPKGLRQDWWNIKRKVNQPTDLKVDFGAKKLGQAGYLDRSLNLVLPCSIGMINFLENFILTTWHELRQRKYKLEWKFRELLDDAEIDLIEDQEKIEILSKRSRNEHKTNARSVMKAYSWA